MKKHPSQAWPGAGPTLVWPQCRRGTPSTGNFMKTWEKLKKIEQGSIDPSVIKLMTAMEGDSDYPAFESRVQEFSETIPRKLKSMHEKIHRRQVEHLERVAAELSQQAIRVGAVKLMKLSYELQAAARLEDFEAAQDIAASLDVEFLAAQESLHQAM